MNVPFPRLIDWKTILSILTLVFLANLTPSARASAAKTGPDLSLALVDSGTVYEEGYSKVSLIVKNVGNAAAPTVVVTYSPGGPVLDSLSPSYVCTPLETGHSGRGGGSRRVGWTAQQSAPVALAPHGVRVIQFDAIYPVGTIGEVWTVNSGTTAQLNHVVHTVSDTVVCIVPPIPSAPRALVPSQSGDSIVLGWKAPLTAGAAVTSSLLTATPTTPGLSVLTATSTNGATAGAIPGVEPSTTYSLTVLSRDIAGSGPVSAPVLFETHAATIPPSPPTNVHASWGAGLVVSWIASVPGNSPVDEYEVSATSSDGGGPVLVNAGASTETSLNLDSSVDSYQISVRAHNAAGWSDWTVPITQPGL